MSSTPRSKGPNLRSLATQRSVTPTRALFKEDSTESPRRTKKAVGTGIQSNRGHIKTKIEPQRVKDIHGDKGWDRLNQEELGSDSDQGYDSPD